MSFAGWSEILGWGENQIEEIQFTGFNFLREGKYLEAIVYFEALLVLDPAKPYHWQTLGALYLQTAQYVKALETLNKALELAPTHEPSQLNKIKTLLLLGQKPEALALARQLERSADPLIAGEASALVMAHTGRP